MVGCDKDNSQMKQKPKGTSADNVIRIVCFRRDALENEVCQVEAILLISRRKECCSCYVHHLSVVCHDRIVSPDRRPRSCIRPARSLRQGGNSSGYDHPRDSLNPLGFPTRLLQPHAMHHVTYILEVQVPQRTTRFNTCSLLATRSIDQVRYAMIMCSR